MSTAASRLAGTPSRAGAAVGRRVLIWLVFLAVSALLAWSADSSFGFGPDQVAYNLVAEELVEDWRRGAPLYSEFGSAYRNSFALLHAAGRSLLGSAEESYKLILFISALAYLSSMYWLMAHVLSSRALAALTAVLSIAQRYTIGTSFWGMGEFQSVLPRIVVLAIFPLAWALFERHVSSRRVLLAFVVAGTGFVLHLSAVYFFCILLLTYTVYVAASRSWHLRFELVTAAAFLLFALPAFPSPFWSVMLEKVPLLAVLLLLVGIVLVVMASGGGRLRSRTAVATAYLLVAFVWMLPTSPLRSLFSMGAYDPQQPEPEITQKVGLVGLEKPAAAAAPEPEPAAEEVAPVDPQRAALREMNRAIYARFGWTLFPISLATLGFAFFNSALPGGLALYEFIRRWRAGPSERERLALYFTLSVLAFSLGATGALQIYCRLTGRPDIVLELFRACRFVFLPIFVYLGLFLQHAWSRARERRTLLPRLALAGLVLLLALPPRQALAALPDGVKRLVRARAAASLHQGDPSQGKYLAMLLATDGERQAARRRRADFLELCAWVRASTPEGSVFLTTDYDFIHEAKRPIMVSYAQGAGSAHSLAVVQGYTAWHEAFTAISGAFESRSPERLVAVAREYETDYVVAPADQPPLPLPVAFRNASFTLYQVSG